MDALDVLILALRLLLVALLYLFLLLVLRMAYAGTRQSASQRLSLRVIEAGGSSLAQQSQWYAHSLHRKQRSAT